MSSAYAGYDDVLKELVLLGADVDAINSVSQCDDSSYISYLLITNYQYVCTGYGDL